MQVGAQVCDCICSGKLFAAIVCKHLIYNSNCVLAFPLFCIHTLTLVTDFELSSHTNTRYHLPLILSLIHVATKIHTYNTYASFVLPDQVSVVFECSALPRRTSTQTVHIRHNAGLL